jgi:hypothetical protein
MLQTLTMLVWCLQNCPNLHPTVDCFVSCCHNGNHFLQPLRSNGAKNMQSTKHQKQPRNKKVKEFHEDSQQHNNKPGFCQDINHNNTDRKLYSDLQGCFPAKSLDRNLYVLVLYAYDDNTILVEPQKNCTEGEQLAAYKKY